MKKGLIYIFQRLLLTLLALACTFLPLEAGYRYYNGEEVLNLENYTQRKYFNTSQPSQYDPFMGWTLKPNEQMITKWDKQVTTLDFGLRSNGAPRPQNKKSILVVGDSFTFGDQVADSETWPAKLEKMTGIPVLNGGVCGYGIDQMIHRAEELVPQLRPDILIVGIIPADVARTSCLELYGVPKPYYTITYGKLEHHTEHMEAFFNKKPPEETLKWKILGHSYLLSSLFFKSSVPLFYKNPYKFAHNKGLKVSRMLLDKLLGLKEDFDVQVVLLLQYKLKNFYYRQELDDDGIVEISDKKEAVGEMIELAKHAHDLGIMVMDSYDMLLGVWKGEGGEGVAELYSGHFSPKGNEAVAQFITGRLTDQK